MNSKTYRTKHEEGVCIGKGEGEWMAKGGGREEWGRGVGERRGMGEDCMRKVFVLGRGRENRWQREGSSE